MNDKLRRVRSVSRIYLRIYTQDQREIARDTSEYQILMNRNTKPIYLQDEAGMPTLHRYVS